MAEVDAAVGVPLEMRLNPVAPPTLPEGWLAHVDNLLSNQHVHPDCPFDPQTTCCDARDMYSPVHVAVLCDCEKVVSRSCPAAPIPTLGTPAAI